MVMSTEQKLFKARLEHKTMRAALVEILGITGWALLHVQLLSKRFEAESRVKKIAKSVGITTTIG